MSNLSHPATILSDFPLYRAPKRSRADESSASQGIASLAQGVIERGIPEFMQANDSQRSFLSFFVSKNVLSQDQRKEKLLEALRLGSQPEFFLLHKQFTRGRQYIPEIASAILESCLELSSDIVAMIPDPLLQEGLQRQLDLPKKNISLIASALILELEKGQVQKVMSYINELLNRHDFQSAQFVIDLIQSEIPKKVRPSVTSEITTLLGYVANYSRWCTFFYRDEKFIGSDEFFAQVFKQDLLELMMQSLQTKTLEQFSNFRPPEIKVPALEKFVEKTLPVYLKENTEAFEFLRLSDCINANQYYDHGFPLTRAGEPLILVEGVLTPISAILDRFTLKKILLGSKAIFQIHEKTTNRTFDYLENGLQPYDGVFGSCYAEKRPPSGKFTVSICSLDHGDTSSPEGIQRLLFTHSWVSIEDAEGNVQSVGLWGDGQLHAPDFYHRTLLPKNINTIEVTREGFEEIFRAISEEQQERKLRPGEFNLVSDNCSCFAEKIAAEALKRSARPPLTQSEGLFEDPFVPIPLDTVLEHADSATKLSVASSLPTRIKCYLGSQELFQAMIQNKTKCLDLFQKLEFALTGCDLLISRSPVIDFKKHIDSIKQPLQEAFESYFHENVSLINKLSFILVLLDALGATENLPAIKASVNFFKNLMRELIVDIQRGDQIKCINKLFNFEMQVLKCIGSLDIKHPYILFQNLSHTDLSRSVTSLSRVKK